MDCQSCRRSLAFILAFVVEALFLLKAADVIHIAVLPTVSHQTWKQFIAINFMVCDVGLGLGD